MEDYLDVFSSGAVRNIISFFSEYEKERNRKSAGITLNDGCYGVPEINIPFEYKIINFVDKHYKCLNEDNCDVYDKTGKKLFSCMDYQYMGYDMFFVNPFKSDGYSLYHNDEKLTEPIFKDVRIGGQFNSNGYAVCGLIEKFGSKAIINKKGQILYKTESYHPLYLHGIIFHTNSDWYNIETLEHIAHSYYSILDTNDYLFFKIEKNCVLQVNKNTGEIIVHGEKPKPKEEPKKEITIKEPEIKVIKQNRNDKCLCGSGKKYKNCCLNKEE